MKPSCFSISQKNCFLDPKPARLYGKLSSQFNFEAFAKLAPKLHATTRANSLRFILAFFVAPSSHSIEYCMTAEPSCLRPKRFGSRKSENPLHEPGLRESRRKRLLPLYSSYPANFRLPASSWMERFSFAMLRSLKSPMFWAFSTFWAYLAVLSPFLPRADFPNVASDPPKRTPNFLT